ncbi:MAG: hypothetical protein LBP60_04225 [Spirochaetaceae bacterium]|jgi:hypothetical protein|nr:hypothetical protein [Spirochaetaceae bacterium]
MKCFICSLDEITLGIPSKPIAQIISAPRVQDALFASENGEGYISLPVLFQKESVPAPHGIRLKDRGNGGSLVLLVPRIDTDMEIPEEEIRSLPDLVEKKLPCFSGVFFSEKGPVLVVDTEKLGALPVLKAGGMDPVPR